MTSEAPRRPLDPKTHRDVAEIAHALILQGLAAETNWTSNEAVFQGGTSLALAWGSKRFSEDLDFLVSRKLDVSTDMRKVARFLQTGLQTHYPGAKVQIKDKIDVERKGGAFYFSIQLSGVIGTVKVKSDFWRVAEQQVQSYGAEYRNMHDRFDMRPLFSVAKPEQVYADKLHAIGSRTYLKWRDLYDIWHIETDFAAQVKPFWTEDATMTGPFGEPVPFAVGQMAHQLSLYSETPREFIEGLLRFAAVPVTELVDRAVLDLKPWLPENVWKRLWPATVTTMAGNALERATALAACLEQHEPRFVELHRQLLQGISAPPAGDEEDLDDEGDAHGDGPQDGQGAGYDAPRGG